MEQNDIAIVPFTVIINGKSYRHHLDMTIDDFWKLLPEKVMTYPTARPALEPIKKYLINWRRRTTP